jgi:hypothetical protein
MESKNKKFEDLKIRREKLLQRKEILPQEIEEFQKRIQEDKFNLTKSLDYIELCDQNRQKAAAMAGPSSGEVISLTKKIRETYEQLELIEATIKGCQGKVKELEVEEKGLPNELSLVENEITRLEFEPLLQEYNEANKARGEIVKEMLSFFDDRGITMLNDWPKFINSSNWRGFYIIDQLSWAGEKAEDCLNLYEIDEQRKRELMEQYARRIREGKKIS